MNFLLLFLPFRAPKVCSLDGGGNSSVAIGFDQAYSISIGYQLIDKGFNVSFGRSAEHDFIIDYIDECPSNYRETNELKISVPRNFSHTILLYIIKLLVLGLIISVVLYALSFHEIPVLKSNYLSIFFKFNFFKAGDFKPGAYSYERNSNVSTVFFRTNIKLTKFISLILYWKHNQYDASPSILPEASFTTDESTSERIINPEIVETRESVAVKLAIDDMTLMLTPRNDVHLSHQGIYELFRVCIEAFHHHLGISGAASFKMVCLTMKHLIDLGGIALGSSLNGRIHILYEILDPDVSEQVFHEFAENYNNLTAPQLDCEFITVGNFRYWGTSLIFGKTRYFLYMTQKIQSAIFTCVEGFASQITSLSLFTMLSFLANFSIIDIMNSYYLYIKQGSTNQSDILFKLIKKGMLIPFSKEFKFPHHDLSPVIQCMMPIIQQRKNCIVTQCNTKHQILVIHSPSSDIVGGFISFLKEQKTDLHSVTIQNSNFMGWLIRVEDLKVIWIMSSKSVTFNDIIQLVNENDRLAFRSAVEHTRRYKLVDTSIKAHVMIFGVYKTCRVSFFRSSDEYFVITVNDEEEYNNSITELRGLERTVSLALNSANVTLWNYEDTETPARIFLSWQETEPSCLANRTTIESNVLIEYQQTAFDNFEHCMQTGQPFMIDIPFLIGSLRWFSIRGIRSSSKTLQLLNIDITQTKEAEERLIEEKRRVEEAMNAKTRFLANMSHEIRNPLNGISGLLELLSDTNLPPGNTENLEILNTSFGKLLDLLNDTLDLAKIEQNKMRPSFTLFNPIEEIDKIISKFNKQPLPIYTLADPTLPCLMYGEPHFLARITSNLLSNAVKFTPSGYVQMNLSSDNNQTFVMTVEDTGIGISMEDKKKLFNIFMMGDSSVTRPYGGIGVGLALCQKMIELINGKIELESTVGKGTKFTVTFPFEARCIPYCPKPVREKNFYVLNLTGLAFLTTRLTPFCEFYGLKQVFKPEDIKGYLAIVIITNLKEQVQIALSLMEKFPKVKLYLSYGRGEQLCYEGPEFKIYQRPIPLSILMSFFSETAWRRRLSSFDQSIYSRTVLLAEDNSTNQLVMRKIFQKLGCEATIVDNGLMAVEKLRNNNYDIVFLDEFMPEMDGHSAAIEIRKFNKQVILVALTASHSKDDEELCLSAGMNDFITKPISISNIRNILVKYSKHL